MATAYKLLLDVIDMVESGAIVLAATILLSLVVVGLVRMYRER